MLEHKPHSIFEAARAVLNRQPIEESTLKKSSDSKSDYEFVIESEGGLIEKIEESLNSIMDPKKKLEIFDKLKKGDEVHIKYIPGGVNEKGSTFTVKNKKNFAKGEQILLSKNDGNAAAKYYLYKRGSAGIVSFSLGDLGSPILDMSIKETVELEEKVGNVVINTHSPSAAKRLAKKLANKWSDLRSLKPNDKSLTVPDVRYIIRYIEIQPEFKEIVESTNLKEAYQPSRYYRAVEENLERLLHLLDPNGQLAKELEKEADNVSSEFSKMKEHIEEALEIWETEVEYTVAMSNAAEDEMIDDIDPSDFDESTFEDEE